MNYKTLNGRILWGLVTANAKNSRTSQIDEILLNLSDL
jgi:hypothetical protein